MRPVSAHMAKKKKKAGKPGKMAAESRPAENDVDAVIALLKRHATVATRDGMVRYGLPSDRAFGVPVGTMKKLAKGLGRNHELAAALWATGWYEARMMAGFIDDPAQVTPAQMERWAKDFDNWGICDTVCF